MEGEHSPTTQDDKVFIKEEKLSFTSRSSSESLSDLPETVAGILKSAARGSALRELVTKDSRSRSREMTLDLEPEEKDTEQENSVCNTWYKGKRHVPTK